MSPHRRCLVLHPGALGDVLLALPALAHLGALGFARVVAVSPRIAALLEGTAFVEATRDFDGLGLHRLFTEGADPGVPPALDGYDAVVSWYGAGDPLYTRRLRSLGVPVVVARVTPGARVHASRHLLDTLAPLGGSPRTVPRARLEPGAAERAWAAAWLRAAGVGPGEAIVLHPGAGSAAKAWSGFPALARRLEGAGRPVVVSAGPADEAAVARVVAAAGLPEARVTGDVPLRRLAALLAEARAYVGNDSGPSHLAGAVGCPALVLFGPTDPTVWAPIGRAGRVLAGAGPAAPDPWGGLTVARVESALAGLGRPVPAGIGAPGVASLAHG